MHELPPELALGAPPAVRPLPPATPAAVAAVRRLEDACLKLPQVSIATEHALHAGIYARTIMIPSGVVLTGAEIKIATILIISGTVDVYGDNGPEHFNGYHVTLGGPGRKGAFLAYENTYLTMLFPTSATTVEEAEREFTDEYEKLLTHKVVS